MALEASYDAESDALYLRLRRGEVARSIEVDHAQVLDVDAGGRVLGIEVLTPARHFDLVGPAYVYGFAHRLTELEHAAAKVVPGLTIEATHSMAGVSYHVTVASRTSFARGAIVRPSTARSDRSYRSVTPA